MSDDLRDAAESLVRIAEDKAAAAQQKPSDVHARVLETAKRDTWNPGDPRNRHEA
jgi:hypothetical protein